MRFIQVLVVIFTLLYTFSNQPCPPYSSYSLLLCSDPEDIKNFEKSTRKERLNEVRRLFMKLWHEASSERKVEPASGGLSGMVGNVVEKLGLKSAKSSIR